MMSGEWVRLHELIAGMDRADPDKGRRVHRTLLELRGSHPLSEEVIILYESYRHFERLLVTQPGTEFPAERKVCLDALEAARQAMVKEWVSYSVSAD